MIFKTSQTPRKYTLMYTTNQSDTNLEKIANVRCIYSNLPVFTCGSRSQIFKNTKTYRCI